ncbi:MAG: hypothetical protein FDZ69_12055 [Deltaproteobacteria bacterium]|nr:MAG: hypothetical protein FDZ69_12055 [Deltaproteobacteria bacterium]
MSKFMFVIFFLIFIATSNSSAGMFSSSYDASNSVVAAVQIDNKVYNLVSSIKFLSKPQDNKPFNTDEYQNMIKQVSTEAQGLIVQKALEAKSMKVSDLAALKSNIEVEIRKLIERTKMKHGVAQNTEVVFTIGSFFLLEPTKD